MRTTIDKAGRVVIPKALRDQVGLNAGEVEITAIGSGLRLEPLARDQLVEQDGHLVVPASGAPVNDELIYALRDAGRR